MHIYFFTKIYQYICICLFTTGPICIDFVKAIKRPLNTYICIINTKSSKQEGKSYLNAKKDNIWENIISHYETSKPKKGF